MSAREAQTAQFLSGSKWEHWQRTKLAGDASARRYERLTNNNDSAILMDAPTHAGNNTRAFEDIATLLLQYGLCSPQIYASDHINGFLLMSDLGQIDLATHARTHPKDTPGLYRAAVDVLVRLHGKQPSMDLQTMTPEVAGDMVTITGIYYANQPIGPIADLVTQALQDLATPADTIALRDYHAENLIWRSDMTGVDRLGLLDFQDAFIAPAGYDLASLLRDVRRDVYDKLAEEMTAHFMERLNLKEPFRAQLALLGAQRNLRILGVFAKLAKVSGKKQYLQLLPRVWANLAKDLRHPALSILHDAVFDLLPPPNAATLDRLNS